MKKAIFRQFGDVENLKIIKAPVPKLSGNEVLVKVNAAGLNPKDILIRKGKFKKLTGSKFPQGIGFDFSGVIEDANQTHFKIGDKVFGMLNGWKGATCAEYVNVNINELYNMPVGMDIEECAGMPLVCQTALQAIRDIGKITKGESILINGGSGGVGTIAIQIAKILGGEVTTVSSTKNLEFCKSLGADHVISYEETELTDLKNQYHIFFDVFGNYKFGKVSHLLTSKGTYITTVPSAQIFKEKILSKFRGRKANLVYVKSNKSDLNWLNVKMSSKEIKPVLDKVFDLDEIAKAQKYIESKRAKGKVVLRIAQ